MRKLIDTLRRDRRDTAILALSLLLAFAIWLISNFSKTYTTVISVPVVAESNIEGHAESSSNAAAVSARCRMSGFNILRIQFHRNNRPVRVHFSSEDLHPESGDHYYIAGSVKNSYVEQIFGIGSEVIGYITDTLRFVFPEVLHKKVPVEFLHTFSYAAQYRCTGSVSLVPDSVTVYGDASALAKMERVFTMPLTKNGVRSSLHGAHRIREVSGIRMSASEVEYSLPVSRYVELSAAKVIQVRNVPSGRRLQVVPSTAEVVFDCLFPLEEDPVGEVEFYIDYQDFASSKSGSCLARSTSMPQSVISCRMVPEVFGCIETVR